jgi:hypothetical protein
MSTSSLEVVSSSTLSLCTASYTRTRGAAFGCGIRQQTSADVSIRQHTAAYVSIHRLVHAHEGGGLGLRHTSAYVSIRQHTAAYVSIRQHTPPRIRGRGGRLWAAQCRRSQHTAAYVSMRRHTSAYVSIRRLWAAQCRRSQHASEYVSMRQHTSAYGGFGLRSAGGGGEEASVFVQQYLSAYVSIRPAYVSIRQHTAVKSFSICPAVFVSIRQHTSCIRQILLTYAGQPYLYVRTRTSKASKLSTSAVPAAVVKTFKLASVGATWQNRCSSCASLSNTPAFLHTSAYVSIRPHASAYAWQKRLQL